MKRKEQFDPQKISSYFLHEKKLLMIITITGLIYNIGLLAGPYYEGQLAQTLLKKAAVNIRLYEKASCFHPGSCPSCFCHRHSYRRLQTQLVHCFHK